MDNLFSFRSNERMVITIKNPEVELGIIKRVGKPKFWVSNNDFNSVMEKIYTTASKRAREIYYNSLKKSQEE